MDNLRKKIQEVNNNDQLTSNEKSQKIFEIMNPNFVNKKKEKDIKFDYDLCGCKHYQRKCLMKAECCGRFVPCRLCHDEHLDHKINRFKTKQMKCKVCDLIQDVGKYCSNCKTDMADYYCSICKFWCNNKSKDKFHCNECGICRIGKRESYFHCKICNSCIDIKIKDSHKCIENSLNTNCSICAESLFSSVKPVALLKCGHYIHSVCLENNIKQGNYQCPMCKKSVCDMEDYWKTLDIFLKDQILPEEYINHYSYIYCNDCEKKNFSKFHFIYFKCNLCNGYNTNLIENFNLGENILKLKKIQRFFKKKKENKKNNDTCINI